MVRTWPLLSALLFMSRFSVPRPTINLNTAFKREQSFNRGQGWPVHWSRSYGWRGSELWIDTWNHWAHNQLSDRGLQGETWFHFIHRAKGNALSAPSGFNRFSRQSECDWCRCWTWWQLPCGLDHAALRQRLQETTRIYRKTKSASIVGDKITFVDPWSTTLVATQHRIMFADYDSVTDQQKGSALSVTMAIISTTIKRRIRLVSAKGESDES